MRIALIHSYYSSTAPSGENQVVERQAEALERAGHTVAIVAERTDYRSRNPIYPLEAAVCVSTGYGRSPINALEKFSPDIVHIHNLFPNYGRRWAERWNGPVVATLHNYRPLCPAGTFFRDNQVCTECLDRRSSSPAVKHRCYRDSRTKTIPLAVSTRFSNDPVIRRADRITLLNSTMLQLFHRGGVDIGKMEVVNNFVPDTEVHSPGSGGHYWLYVGRLSQEKGILDLVRRWPNGHDLLIVGSGPHEAEIMRLKGPNVRVLGPQTADRVHELMRSAVGLVFPSRMLEGLALVCLESLAAGTPILAWDPAPAAEAVRRLGVGLVSTSQLQQDLDFARQQFPRLRSQCREVFDRTFTETAWINTITRTYHNATGANARIC